MPDYDDEDVATIKGFCEEWGRNWQIDFQRNLTPKAHDMIFVLPTFIEIHKTFYMFYKIEQAGESIHAVLNEIVFTTHVWIFPNMLCTLLSC